MASVLPTKYAQALIDLLAGAPEAELESTLGQLRLFVELYRSSGELRAALGSPAVPVATRQKVVAALVARLEIGDLLRRFLLVVCEHGRMSLLGEMTTAFEERIDARLQRLTADVRVAATPTDSQRDAIQARLASITGKSVRARFAVDEDLLGGFRAQIGSTVYDASVRGQFDALRHRLGEVT